MYAVGRLSSYISQGVYTVSAPFHPFGGAVDIIVVEQPDGSFKSSPWYVKFGKFQGVLKTKEKIVNVCINEIEADFHMYLDHKGEAYFLKEVDEEEIDPTIFSPPSSGDETDDQSGNGRKENSKNYDFNVKQPSLDSPTDFNNEKIMVRTSSGRSRIFGLMFGRKSMKEKNKQEEGGDIRMERFSSLERAEIAADLLEVKWSTNLPTDISRRDGTSRLSARNMPAKEPDKGSLVNDEQGLANLLVHDSMENNFDHSFVQEATCPYGGKMGNSSMSSIGDTECSNGVNSPDQSLKSKEHDNDVYMLKTGVLDDKFDLENATSENREESGFATSIPSVRNSHMGKHEGGSDTQYKVEGPSDERACFLDAGVSSEENEVVCCEPSENSRVGVDSNGKGHETLNLSQEECKEAQVLAGDICETAKVIPEVNSQPEGAALMNIGNPNNIKLPSDEDLFQCEESSFREDTKNGVTEYHSSLDIHSVASKSGEAEILELIHQETVAERLGEGRNLQTELVDAFANQSQEIGSSHPRRSGIREVRLEPSKAPESFGQIVSGNLVEEADSRVCISSSSSNSIRVDQEEEDFGEEDEMNNLHKALGFVDDPKGSRTECLSKNTAHLSSLPLESSVEEQFVFSDIDDFVQTGVGCEDSAFPDSLEIENDPLVTMNDNEDLNKSTNMDHKSHLSSVKLYQECSPKAFEALLEESTAKSSPMSIPGSRKRADEEVGWTVESLPIFRSHIDNLEISDVLHPLSHSLDSHSEKLRQEVLLKDVSGSSKIELDTNHQLAEDDPTIKDIRIWEEFKNMSTKSTVELSLCKHLLYEGMGADAASQAFDAEKVDLDKCASLGPQLVKNDNLIVRIGGRYFPWDAAASYVLEMFSLGHDQIFEPEGMIAVDRVEKTVEREPPRTNVPSGGSWTLWPFSLRRSITINPVQPAPDGTNDSNIINASESFSDATGNKSPPLVKVAKKKVKSIVPTSEQLATLNLNEGRNVITFTFSTAMLGKQQVDARIYLWKWNTRIVVSDVDGTITRSDVLGQFMPLVGKDWSHIGVAHLFSAIKENGYQLLFLSARAISQAYLTRQFLFNLKQDGKALPDGPVVISPDGLFPSLFREVIRRAPHEFKIACLQDIRALFPPDCSPFYAGFGNRITDEISYRKLGIPKGKIFIINARGEVAVNRRFDRKSYTSLHGLVDGMFPATTSAEQEDFNSWNYWRMPLPDINS